MLSTLEQSISTKAPDAINTAEDILCRVADEDPAVTYNRSYR